MQCLDDQLDYSPVNSTANTWTEWEVVNKVADTSNSQHRHSAKGKAMSHRSATPSLHGPHRTAVLFFLLALASVESVALHQTSPLPVPESVDIASPLQPVLALNSSVAAHNTIAELHSILAPLTDDEPDPDAFENAENAEEVNHSSTSRSKREALDQPEYDGSSLTKTPKNKNKNCYIKALRRCGRTFVNSYKFVRVKNNKDNDILVAQCALRTAFFDCLKARASECNKEKPAANEITGKVKKDGKRAKRTDRDDAPTIKTTNITKRKEKFDKRLRKNLAETIWDSRVCIFKNSLKINPGPL